MLHYAMGSSDVEKGRMQEATLYTILDRFRVLIIFYLQIFQLTN